MNVQRTFPELETTHRLARRLQAAAIPYAILGAMAVHLHGADNFMRNVEFLLTAQGLDQFRKEFVAANYSKVPGRRRHFVDVANGVTIQVRLTGHYPSRDGDGPFAFPDPSCIGQEIGEFRVLALAELIQFNLGGQRYHDLADVVSLIRKHQLDETFLVNLHSSVHRDFIKCLEEKRREDEHDLS